MCTLLADRFVCHGPAERFDLATARSVRALDLATGEYIRLRIRAAGGRADQHAWIEACAQAHASGALVDYGFIGTDRRFEATRWKGVERARAEPVPREILEWLDSYRPSSARVLRVEKVPDARELRVRGFVPIHLSVLSHESIELIQPIVRGRSIVVLDRRNEPSTLALELLKLRQADARDWCALSARTSAIRATVENAAEGRAMYEARPSLARPATLFTDGERLLAKGRHAAAERSLRAAIGAFDRRGDAFQAAAAELTLGKLMLTRGRPAKAVTCFEHAHGRFQRARAPGRAICAMLQLGMAQVDLSLLSEAERSCRAAHSAASALKDSEATAAAGLGLVRSLLWQQRYAEARDVLESIAPPSDREGGARYWCLAARLQLVANGFRDAMVALERARPSAHDCDPVIDSLVHRWEAVVQARLGDLQAVEFHVQTGLAAARAAHLPLRAMKLRLALIEGLMQSGKVSRARAIAAHLSGISRSSIPPALELGIEQALAQKPASAAWEAVADFHSSDATKTVQDLDGLRELLFVSHQYEDEGEALARAAATIRKHTHALGVSIYGCLDGQTRALGSAGTAGPALAHRSCNAGITVGPERTSGGVESAVPMRYLGRLIGALSIRWTIEGPEHGGRAIAFSSAAAAACAPLVYVMQQRQGAPQKVDPECDLLGASAAIEDVRKAIGRAANAPFTVLIEGESGSGKELVARAIHRTGCRRERPFCAFNCAAMPEDLVDAELFGHAKGAFTGAAGERVGLFESADGGTLFLDEVGELSARAQAKVLRALQEGEVRRVGENFTRTFDARLVAATNRSLRAEVEGGRFRQDLLYRLDVIRVVVPPLRERVEDIPLLATRFWRASAERIGSKAVLGQSALSALARYHWPGNVRELQNVLTALVVAAPSRGVVGASDLPAAIARATQPASRESLETARLKFEQRFVRAALARAAGHRGQTAAALGLSRQGLAKLMQRLQLEV